MLRRALSRAYTHSELDRASRAFAQGRTGLPRDLLAALGATEISTSLQDLARLFQRLQDARHKADYDLSISWRRSVVVARIAEAEEALAYLRDKRGTRDLHVYLASLLAWSRMTSR